MTCTPLRRARGFTLLELLVVVMIIGLLASYVGPRYFAQIGKSEVAAARSQIEALSKALDAYRIDVGSYPTTAEGLGALNTRPESARGWNGPYLKKAVPLDPWQHPYVYQMAPGAAEYQLLSYGKDGKPGGRDEEADLTN